VKISLAKNYFSILNFIRSKLGRNKKNLHNFLYLGYKFIYLSINKNNLYILNNNKITIMTNYIIPKEKSPYNFLQAFADTDSSRAIWLLFLDTNTSLERFFTDINIPFDCQFLVAQPQSDHVVVLTEVYRVNSTLPLHTYRFGNWTPGGGLTWPSEAFYVRRKNLKGFTIHATRLSVRGNLYVM